MGFYLLPVHTWPELAESVSPALWTRLTGKALFTFNAIDEAVTVELEALVARSTEAYIAAG